MTQVLNLNDKVIVQFDTQSWLALVKSSNEDKFK